MKEILKKVCDFIEALTTAHTKQIFDDCKKYKNIPNKIFCNAIEIEKGLKMFCYGLRIEAVTQSIIILRQLTEQILFLDVASNHTESFEIIDLYAKLKLGCLKYDNETDTNIKAKYKKNADDAERHYKEAKAKFPKIKKLSRDDFLEYGWMLSITDECGIEKLYELANFQAIKKWRKLCNAFVHNTFSFHQYSYEEKERTIVEATYITIALLDAYMCSYHLLTGFDFIINNINYRELLQLLRDEFSNCRKKLYL